MLLPPNRPPDDDGDEDDGREAIPFWRRPKVLLLGGFLIFVRWLMFEGGNPVDKPADALAGKQTAIAAVEPYEPPPEPPEPEPPKQQPTRQAPPPPPPGATSRLPRERSLRRPPELVGQEGEALEQQLLLRQKGSLPRLAEGSFPC